MNDLREAARQALEALEEAKQNAGNPEAVYFITKNAITALRAALDSNQFNPDWDTQSVLVEEVQRMAKEKESAYQRGYMDGMAKGRRLEQPAQDEPVAWLIWLHGPAGHFDHKQFAELEFERRNKEYPDPNRKLLPLYTRPQAREPLTDEQIGKATKHIRGIHCAVVDEIARAIEAAHGIKGDA